MGRLRGTANKGARIQFPFDLWIPTVSSAPGVGSAQVINASGEYVDFQFQAEEAKAIASFMARFGSITAGDAATPFELNNVDDTAQPSRPGATVHASGTIDSTTGGYANTSRLFTFGATYTPTKGQLLAAKIGFAGSQNLQIVPTTDKGAQSFPFVHTFLDSAHAVRSGNPIFGVEYSDGTWMRIPWCYPISAIGTTGYSNSGTNEYGMRMVLPFSMMVDTITVFHDADANDQFKLSIRSSDRVSLGSLTVEGDVSSSVTYGPKSFRLTSPIHMRAGKVYFVTKESTTANNIDIAYMDAFEAAAMDAFLGNANCYQVSRDNDTDVVFTENTTRKVLIGVEGYAVG
jgi:hypothetical protein